MRIQIGEVIAVSVVLVSGWSCSTEKLSMERERSSAAVVEKSPATRESPAKDATEKSSAMRECLSIDAGDYYFPIDVSASLRNWYSKHLRAMQEPSLYCGRKTAQFAYRFLWLRTFHHPIAVRIEKEGSSTVLHAVELDGRGGYAPGKPLRQVDRTLSPAEQERLMMVLKKTWYWGTPRYIVPGGIDGAEWILEGAENGQYQIMVEWSPRVSVHSNACLLFLELAGFSVAASETY